MSQHVVERVLGRLLTDEGLRRRFAADREEVLAELLEIGFDLNPCELRAFRGLDPLRLQELADHLDPCIQKVQLGRPDRTHRATDPVPGANRMSIETSPPRLHGERVPQSEPDALEKDHES